MERLRRMLPASLLRRARVGALGFAFLTVLTQPVQLNHHAPGKTLAVAALAMVGLLVLATVTFVRGRIVPGDAVISAVLLVAASIGLTDPMGIVALSMCPSVVQAGYGSNRSAVARTVMVGLSMPVTLMMSPRTGAAGHLAWASPSVLGAVLMLTVSGLMIRGIYQLVHRQERASARIAVLSTTGNRLLNYRDLADAEALIWQTALDLQSLTPGVAVAGARLDGEAYVVDAVAGLSESALGHRLSAADLDLPRADRDPVRLPLDPTRHWQIFRTGDGRILLAGAVRDIPADVADAFVMLCTQAELAENNRAAHNELLRQARHDQLTALPNRATLFARLASLVDAAQSGIDAGDSVDVLMVIDLDDFKEVNDTYGHAGGDELLMAVAARLTAAAGDTGLAARFGGDEFALLLTGIAGSDDVARRAERICRELRAPVTVGGVTVEVGASIGVVDLTPTMTAGDHMRCADIAMYAAKARGKSRVERFDPAVHGEVATVTMMEHHLAHAIANDEIAVDYQPQVDLTTGDCTGVDAVPYWAHPVLGRIEAAAFLPLAERTGHIAAVGAHILQTVCRHGAALVALPGYGDLRITTRIAVRQLLDPGLPAVVADALRATGLPGHRLTLEVPAEHLADDDIGARLHRLADAGVGIAVDGFGRGPLTALCALPIDQFRFPAHLPDSADPGTELELIVAAGRILNLRTTALGVDTAAQRDALRDAGIDTGQGAVYAEPMISVALIGWLTRRPDQSGRETAPADHSFA